MPSSKTPEAPLKKTPRDSAVRSTQNVDPGHAPKTPKQRNLIGAYTAATEE